MGTIPNSRLGKIQFYEAHITPWTNNAAAIGLSLPDVANLTTLTGEARTAYDEHMLAQDAAKSATQNFYNKVSAMHGSPNAGSDMIETIRIFAQTTDDPNVYTLAQIPPPAPPGVVGPPGTPDNFRVALLQNGAVELGWKCQNPAGGTGTVYEILRSDNGGPFVFVATAGTKNFTDDTIPANTSPVTYQITGVRSTVRGDPAQFTVKFGADGVTQSQSESSGGSDLSIAA